ncbi:MAG: hypothetical protein PUD31_09740, partial [Solobacterium sp.]|nr:hypothetical protein [Solobacterium sp.]
MKFKKIVSSLMVFFLVGIFACTGVFAATGSTETGVSNSNSSTFSSSTEATQSVKASSSTVNPTVNTKNRVEQNESQTVQQENQNIPSIIYKAHIQNIGTQKEAADGALAGTVGKGYRLEAFQAHLKNAGDSTLSYSAHVQNIGWQKFVNQNAMAGTTGKSLRIEAIKIKLGGAIANQYDVVYRLHVQNAGWLNWARNGEPAGSVGKSLRIEAMQIKLVKKGETPTNDPVNTPSANSQAFLYDAVKYQTHVQNVGTQSWKADGETAGTTGKALRVEGIAIQLADPQYLGVSGNVIYRAHVQNI